jgi:hypothetical protein
MNENLERRRINAISKNIERLMEVKNEGIVLISEDPLIVRTKKYDIEIFFPEQFPYTYPLLISKDFSEEIVAWLENFFENEWEMIYSLDKIILLLISIF